MEDVLRMLMEAWGALLSRSWCSPGAHGGGDHDTQTPPEIVNGAAQVFQAYLQAGLRAVAEAGGRPCPSALQLNRLHSPVSSLSTNV